MKSSCQLSAVCFQFVFPATVSSLPTPRTLQIPSFPRHRGFNRKLRADSRELTAYLLSFGGSVNPNTEIMPVPATFTLLSPGVGR